MGSFKHFMNQLNEASRERFCSNHCELEAKCSESSCVGATGSGFENPNHP